MHGPKSVKPIPVCTAHEGAKKLRLAEYLIYQHMKAASLTALGSGHLSQPEDTAVTD